jgi:hypothetical protein
MASPGARAVGATDTNGHGEHRGRTLAQLYCTVVGATLLLVGLLGFLVDSTFDTTKTGNTNESGLQGDGLLGFEVNGWHNVVHILSGIFLLASARKWKSAKFAATAFGVVYGIVAIIGLIDGEDVLGIIPVNAADNILHIVLSALGLYTGLKSRGDDEHNTHGVGTRAGGQTVPTASGTRTPAGHR